MNYEQIKQDGASSYCQFAWFVLSTLLMSPKIFEIELIIRRMRLLAIDNIFLIFLLHYFAN